jgi:hypothetical protein
MRLAALVFAFLITGSANAATIETLSIQPVPPPQIWTVPCTHTLTGEIVEGDAARLQAELGRLTMQHDDRNYVICLSSPGGNLVEGLKIGELIRANWMATYVPPNAECLSACAIAFMHGRIAFWEDLVNYRVIHPTAKLGFHAPSLDLPTMKGAVPAPLVDAAYASAISVIAQLTRSASGGVDKSKVALIPLSLLEQMLSTPSDEFLYVETLHQAFLWDIEIYPAGIVAPPDFDPAAAEYQLCLNADYETKAQNGGLQNRKPVTAEDVKWHQRYKYPAPDDLAEGYSYVTMDDLWIVGCGIKFRPEHGFLDVRQYIDQQFVEAVFLPAVYLFSPETRIRDLWPN